MDRFTMLPNALLITIISLLPFKEAGRTSILSTKTRFLWRETTNIDFDERYFVKREHSAEERKIRRRKFIAYINQWIENYPNKNLEHFRLCFINPKSFRDDIDRFIVFAMSRNVRFLRLEFPNCMHVLPEQFYENRRIEFLILNGCKIDASKFKGLVSLTQLFLGCTQLQSPILKTLLCNCPRLTSLHLKACILDSLVISTPVLVSLNIDNCVMDDSVMTIKAPKLRFLKYNGDLSFFDYVGEHKEIVSLDLDYGIVDEFFEDSFYWSIQLLNRIKILKVCSYLLQVIPTTTAAGFDPPLQVQHLTLKTNMHENDFLGITFLLDGCPVLNTLTINMSNSRILKGYESPCEIEPRSYWIENAKTIPCVERALKVVRINGFKGSHNEIQFLHYVLNVSRVLEKLIICVSREDDGRNGESYKQNLPVLNTFGRASPILQILIS